MKSGFVDKAIFITIYSVASIATFDLNKYIMQIMKFQMHYLLVVIQCILIVLIVLGQSVITGNPIRYTQHTKWYIPTFFFTAMILTGMKAIYYFMPTLFTLYKNIAIIVTAIAELYFFQRRITWIAVVSFIIMILSSLFGNTIDKVEWAGYIWMAGNIFATTAYVLYLKKLMSSGLSTRTESVLFTNMLSVPPMLVLSLIFDDLIVPVISSKLIILIVASGFTAYFTSFSTAWSMKILSSTSYSMIGALNKLAFSVSGFILFDEQFEYKKLVSFLIGVLASLIYSLDNAKIIPTSQVQAIETAEHT